MKTGRPEKTIHPDFQEYFKNDVNSKMTVRKLADKYNVSIGKIHNLKKEMKMAEKNKQTVTIDEEEYALDDLTDLQKYMLEQVMDLKVKIKTTSRHLDQLKVASAEFSSSLAKSIKQKSQGEENEKT
tara:strand:- start:332 stop:712 length:381 start_codon:yes stop_codon:yes gene_type:complete